MKNTILLYSLLISLLIPTQQFAAVVSLPLNHVQVANNNSPITNTEIETKLGDRCTSITVPSYRFPSLSWPAEGLGARGIISPGVATKDHLRAAIQHLPPSIQSRHVYEHTGWRQIESGLWVFMHGAGAIGPAPSRNAATRC